MGAVMRCVYKFDSLRCTLEFAHLGEHEAVIPGRETPLHWEYDKALRRADEKRGGPQCDSQWMDPGRDIGEVYRCCEMLGHEGDHRDIDVTWTDEAIDTILNPPEEPEPEPVQREIPEHVRRALDERAELPAIALALRGSGGTVVRYDEVVEYDVHPSGALRICTRTEDIGYAPNAWSSLTAEPARH